MAEPFCMSLFFVIDLLICMRIPSNINELMERELSVACCQELFLSPKNLMLLYISHFINTI